MALSLGQDVFCDCGMDVIEYTVKEIHQTEDMTYYTLRSKKGVGRNRFIEVSVFENKEGTIRYMQLEDSQFDDGEFAMEPFTEGKYFTTLEAAKSSFAKTQIELIEANTEDLKRRIAENDRRVARWTSMLK